MEARSLVTVTGLTLVPSQCIRTATKYRNNTTPTCRPAGLFAALPRSATDMTAPAGSSGRSGRSPESTVTTTPPAEDVPEGARERRHRLSRVCKQEVWELRRGYER